MIDTNRQILKALDFIEKDFNQLQKKKEKISFGVAQQALFFLTNEFIFNYLKISSFYFKEQALFFIPREEQKLASVFLEKFDEYVELKDMDFFILASKNLSLWKEQDCLLYARCRNVLAANFSFLTSPAKADLYSKEIRKMEENLHGLKKLEMEIFSASWFESFNHIFPSSFKKFKKNLVFLSHLLVLREKKVKNLVRQIRKKKLEIFWV